MFTVEEAILYIEGWGHICIPQTDGQVKINWIGDKTETVTPRRVIEHANEIWNANEGIIPVNTPQQILTTAILKWQPKSLVSLYSGGYDSAETSPRSGKRPQRCSA